MGVRRFPPGIMAVKFVALIVLICSIKSEANQGTKNSLDRKCKNSEPFLIKNEKKRKAYLTVDVETAVVSGGKKNGEASQRGMLDLGGNSVRRVQYRLGARG